VALKEQRLGVQGSRVTSTSTVDRLERVGIEQVGKPAPGWFKPTLDPSLYKPIKPNRTLEVWSGVEGDLYAARVPDWLPPPQANYAVSRGLMEELLTGLKRHRRVLVVPDAEVSSGVFLLNERLRRIAQEAGVSEHADFQPLSTPPATVAGIVDALMEAGTEEIHILIDSPWLDPLRVAWEAGYVEALSRPEYAGRVFFVNPYAGKPELEHLPIKWAEGFDTGFYNHVTVPKALLKERYDVIVVATPAKTHALNLYSLLMRLFGRLWRAPRLRWHLIGFPLRLFDSDYLSKAFGIEVPEGRGFEVIQVGERAIISNGFSSSAPLPVCVEGGEMQAACDPYAGPSNLLPLQLSMGYSTIRYLSSYATVVDELVQSGTRLVGLVSAIVGMEGEGPLIYGERRFEYFAVAGESPLATEALALDAMFGYGGRGFEGAVLRLNRRFCEEYILSEELEEEIVFEAADPWTLKLAEELVREERDPSRYTLTLLDFSGNGEVNSPWTLRRGPPFKLPKLAYIPPKTLMKAVVSEARFYKRALYPVEKGITVPLPELIGA